MKSLTFSPQPPRRVPRRPPPPMLGFICRSLLNTQSCVLNSGEEIKADVIHEIWSSIFRSASFIFAATAISGTQTPGGTTIQQLDTSHIQKERRLSRRQTAQLWNCDLMTRRFNDMIKINGVKTRRKRCARAEKSNSK